MQLHIRLHSTNAKYTDRMIRKGTIDDAAAIAEIYNYYIENTVITFDIEPITKDKMAAKLQDIAAKFPFFVVEENSEVVGYCYLNYWKNKAAYDYTLENSVYVKSGFEGKGYGQKMVELLIDKGRKAGIHSIMAVITLPGEASVALHEKLGFTKVSHYKEVGQKFNRWIDVGSWQKIL